MGYLHASAYYAADGDVDEYPPRQGDIFAYRDAGAEWLSCMLIHPICELAKAVVPRVQVIRVTRVLMRRWRLLRRQWLRA